MTWVYHVQEIAHYLINEVKIPRLFFSLKESYSKSEATCILHCHLWSLQWIVTFHNHLRSRTPLINVIQFWSPHITCCLHFNNTRICKPFECYIQGRTGFFLALLHIFGIVELGDQKLRGSFHRLIVRLFRQKEKSVIVKFIDTKFILKMVDEDVPSLTNPKSLKIVWFVSPHKLKCESINFAMVSNTFGSWVLPVRCQLINLIKAHSFNPPVCEIETEYVFFRACQYFIPFSLS